MNLAGLFKFMVTHVCLINTAPGLLNKMLSSNTEKRAFLYKNSKIEDFIIRDREFFSIFYGKRVIR